MVGSDYKEDYFICKIVSDGIQTQDLTVCPYLNLKHGKLGHSAGLGFRMFYLKYSKFKKLFVWSEKKLSISILRHEPITTRKNVRDQLVSQKITI